MEFKNLVEAATIQAGLLDELLTVLEQETIQMGAVDISSMAGSNQHKEMLIDKIAEHAPVLKRGISAAAVRAGLPAETSFGILAELLDKKGIREPLAKQNQIKVTADKIQQVAELNRDIAERFASTVTTTLNLITRLINQSNVYGSSGGYLQRRTGAVIINMEA